MDATPSLWWNHFPNHSRFPPEGCTIVHSCWWQMVVWIFTKLLCIYVLSQKLSLKQYIFLPALALAKLCRRKAPRRLEVNVYNIFPWKMWLTLWWLKIRDVIQTVFWWLPILLIADWAKNIATLPTFVFEQDLPTLQNPLAWDYRTPRNGECISKKF